MTWQRSILLVSMVLIGMLAAQAAQERQFAGIQLGMKPEDVKAILGEPDAVLIAQPPVMIRSAGLPSEGGAMSGTPMPGMMPGMTGMPGAEDTSDKPNSLILIYKGQEIEIGSSEVNPGLDVQTANPSGTSSSSAVSVPYWAYVVRAGKMALDQQEFIYQVNDTYALGIIITGRRNEAKVSDVIACSYDPLKKQGTPGTSFTDFSAKKPNFFFKRRGILLEGFTAKNITLGSRFDEVLKKYLWTEYLFPYVANNATTVIISTDPKNPNIQNTTIKIGLRSQEGKTTSLGTGPSNMASGLPGMPGSGTGTIDLASLPAAGDNQVAFTDGDKVSFNAGFSKSCFMLYPDSRIAFSIVDFIVVRIHIGSGVIPPPPPPKIKSKTGAPF